MNDISALLSADARAGVVGKADSIYFMMSAGWKAELRSNRWHYASRWAQHLPVILCQPTLADDEPSFSEPEPRIRNCRVLHVCRAAPPYTTPSCSLIQARHILADMRAHGHRKPIFWAYSPDYLFAHAVIPAAARVYHGSENYFSFERNSPGFLDRLKVMLATSDLVVTVSKGVGEAYRPHAGHRLEVVTNGCDYKDYARGGHDPELAAARQGWPKLVVYAGNINLRIDLDLLHKSVRACSQFLFALFGPIDWGTADETRQWELLIREPNVRYFGPVGIDRLPPIFGTADVGLIPYRRNSFVVDNIFPLKTFEMQATGLPVVSTYMNAIETLGGPGLCIARDDEAFIAGIRNTARATLTADDRATIDRASRAQDYDVKFARVFDCMSEVLAARPEPWSPAAELFGMQHDPQVWLAIAGGTSEQALPPALPQMRDRLRAEVLQWLTPVRDVVKGVLPAPVWTRLRRLWH
jgi:glycosyltransferase involved in cell wall biosynthesis